MFSRNTLCDGSTSGDEEGLVLPLCRGRRRTIVREPPFIITLLGAGVGRISSDEQKQVLDKMVAAVDEDVEGILRRVRQRFDAVGLEIPKSRFDLRI